MKYLPLAVLIFFAFLTGCHNDIKGDSAIGKQETIWLSEGYSDEQISQAIKRALSGRGWTLVSEEDNVIVGRLNHRKVRAELKFVYDEEQIVITSDSYKDFDDGNRPAIAGNPGASSMGKSASLGNTVPYYPGRWVANLVKDIRRMLP